MPALYTNNVAGVTATDIGPSDTVVLLSAGQGAQFPQPTSGQWFWATLIHPVSHVVEIVQCTARSADSLTVVRGRDATTAVAFPAGSVLEMRVVAQMWREVEWRSQGNQPNGIPILDSGGKVGTAQLPDSIPYMVGGVVPLTVLPIELLTETEGNAAYGRLAMANTWAEKQTFAKDVLVSGNLQVGGGGGQIGVGDDGIIRDINRQNMLAIIGGQDPTRGGFQFGEGGGALAWDPPTGNFQVFPTPGAAYGIFHGGNFNPNTKANVDGGAIYSMRAYRQAFGPEHGLVYFGQGNNYILYDSANFVCSNNFYAPNLIGSSDERLKKSIRRHRTPNGISDKVELVSWLWRKALMDGAPAGRWTGPLAQAVQKFAPWHVHEGPGGWLGVDKAGLALEVGVDAAARIRELEADVAELKELVKHLMKKPR